jgi:hypothetical protein
MNKDSSHAPTGKILIHDQGVGPTDESDIERRAHELALIDGRSAATEEDWERAEKELAGDGLPPIGDEGESTMDSLSRDPSDPPVHRGRQVPDYDGSEEEKTTERLVAEGVEEAQHDQMLAARRRREE